MIFFKNNRFNHQRKDNNQYDEIHSKEKKFIIPALIQLQNESKNK